MKQERTTAVRKRHLSKVVATTVAVVFLPPFIALALAPMMLMLVPVALVGIPFILPAVLTGSLAARSENRRRTSTLEMRRKLALVR